MNQSEIIFRDLGTMDYREAWDYQEKHFQRLVDYKQNPSGREPPPQYLLFCEHPHVYTLGKSGDADNLLISEDFLSKIQATFYKTNRGGDITYHGPGQIVGYPILDLEDLGIGLKQYIHLLEQIIMKLLKSYGITASGKEGATGVWLDAEHPAKARKICAIGVRSGRFVTMHGFALNVNTDLKYFSYIHPCGFQTGGVTSLEKELGRTMDMERARDQLRKLFLEKFREHGDKNPGNSSSAFPSG